MAYERIGEKPRDQVMVNGHRAVYVAQDALAVRVTVRRDGLTKSAEVEVISPDADGWSPVVLESVRVDGSAASGRVGAVLTFPGGEQVTIGATEAPSGALKRDHTLGMLEGERQIEALRASARCVDPPTSDGAREEPAPQAARWWQTVGAWGATFGDGFKRVDAYHVVQVEGDRGAWVRSMPGALELAPAGWLEAMTPIAAPPGFAGAEERDALRAELGAGNGETLVDAARRNARHLMSIVAELDETTAQLRRIGYAIDAEPGADIVAEVIRLRDNARVALKNSNAAYAALVKAEGERDAARDALASLESTFRHLAESERNGAREAFKDPWTKAADEVVSARKWSACRWRP